MQGETIAPAEYRAGRSIRRFIEVARKESGPLMLGYLCTTWTDVTPLVKGLAGEPVESDDRHLGRVVSGVKLGAELSRGASA